MNAAGPFSLEYNECAFRKKDIKTQEHIFNTCDIPKPSGRDYIAGWPPELLFLNISMVLHAEQIFGV